MTPKIDVVLIDGDVIPYELGGLKDTHPILKHIEVPIVGPYLEKLVDNKITSIINATGAERYEMVLSGKGNWRFEVAKQTEYKGNRKHLEKPYNWQSVRNIVEANYNPFITKGYEGDDELIRRNRMYKEQGIVACVGSIDKDMRTDSGWHYNWRKDKAPVYISELEALRFYYLQILTGDSADNIPGCAYDRKILGKKGDKKGVGYMRRYGIRGAEALIEACTTEFEMYQVCLEQYSKKFSPREAPDLILENARLLYMGCRNLEELYEFPFDTP